MNAARLSHEFVGEKNPDRVLEALLAMDRTVMEFFMQVYGTPRRHKLAMREQNRRLHDAVRKRLPKILSLGADPQTPMSLTARLCQRRGVLA